MELLVDFVLVRTASKWGCKLVFEFEFLCYSWSLNVEYLAVYAWNLAISVETWLFQLRFGHFLHEIWLSLLVIWHFCLFFVSFARHIHRFYGIREYFTLQQFRILLFFQLNWKWHKSCWKRIFRKLPWEWFKIYLYRVSSRWHFLFVVPYSKNFGSVAAKPARPSHICNNFPHTYFANKTSQITQYLKNHNDNYDFYHANSFSLVFKNLQKWTRNSNVVAKSS